MGLTRKIPANMSREDFIAERASKVPAFDAKEHARLIGNAGSTPLFMSAREILTTHNLLEDHAGRTGLDPVSYKAMLIARKTKETFGSTTHVNEGTGTGENLADSITKNGYDWSKPLPLTVKGLNYEADGGGKTTSGTPLVVQGHHRLAYMWTFHPDEPIPVDIANHNHIWLPGESTFINNVHMGHQTPEEAKKQFNDKLSARKVTDDRE